MQSYSLSSWHQKRLFMGAISLLLVLLLAACGDTGGNNTTSTPTPSSNITQTPSGSSTPTGTPPAGITLGPKACPDAVKAPTHWDPIIPTQANVSKVESVTCANLIGVPKLQALVTVRNAGSGAILDVYVYNNIIDPNPAQIFKLPNLSKGDAKISGYNSVLTAEVDAGSSANTHQPNANLVQDLFREFKWSDQNGTLVQIVFSGIFPDLTRYQAEADQAQVNQGHQPWKLSATMTTQALAASQNFLKWDPNATATIVSGGGDHDTDAVVTVKNTGPVGGSIKVSMKRLEGNTNGGIWIVTSVASDGMSITAPQSLDRLSSPTTVTGTGNAFEGKIGQIFVLDHLLTDIGHVSANGAIGNGATSFFSSVSYKASFHGLQEGLVALYSYSQANGTIAGAVIVKELLGA